MTDNSMYRIAADGINTGYGPYSTLGAARNTASNVHGGGSWEGVNSKSINKRFYSWVDSTTTHKDILYTIQKLTPALKQIHPSGAFALKLEWIDLDG